MDGIWWILVTGSIWNQLPERYGKWNSVYRFHLRWARRGVFSQLLAIHAEEQKSCPFIIRAEVTNAAVHDSQALDTITRQGDPETSLDSGYAGKPCADILAAKGIPAQVCEKGTRGKPLTPRQKRSNRSKSRKRSRGEHVFGFMTVSMNAMYKRYVGMVRNRASIILCNLVYNMARTEQIIRLKILGRATPSLG